MSYSSQPHGLQPTRLLHPWDFPGKSTGVGQDLLKQSKMRPAVSSVTAYAKHLEINLQYHYLKGICRSLTFLLCFRPSKGAPYVESLCLWERKKAKLPSCVRLFATPWTVAHQAPLSMGFSRQEHWSGLPFPSPTQESKSEVVQSCPTLRDPMDCSPPGSSVHGIFHTRVPEWRAIASIC